MISEGHVLPLVVVVTALVILFLHLYPTLDWEVPKGELSQFHLYVTSTYYSAQHTRMLHKCLLN